MTTPTQLAEVMAKKTDAQLLEMFPKANDWTPEALDAARVELHKRSLPIPPVAPPPPQPPRPQGKAANRYAASAGRFCGIVAFLWAISGLNPDAGHLLRWQFNVLLGGGAFAISMLAYLIGSLVDRTQKPDANAPAPQIEISDKRRGFSEAESAQPIASGELRWYHLLVAILLPYIGLPWGIVHLVKKRRKPGMSLMLISGFWLVIIVTIIILAENHAK